MFLPRTLLSIALVALALAPAANASPEDPYSDDWVAIAVSPSNGLGGYGAAGNPDQASKIAMDECTQRSAGTLCQVAEVMEYGCVGAVVNTVTGAWAGGRGSTVDEATADAATKLPAFNYGDVRGGGWCSTPVTPP